MEFLDYIDKRLLTLRTEKKYFEDLIEVFISETGWNNAMKKQFSFKEAQRKSMIIQSKITELELVLSNTIPNYNG